MAYNVTMETTPMANYNETWVNFSDNSSASVNDFPEDEPGVYIFIIINKVMMILLIILGNVGNIISIMILIRPDIGAMPTKIYLVTLATVDLLCIDVVGTFYLLLFFEIDITSWHDIICKLIRFSAALFAISYWSQVALSVERCYGIVYPFKYHVIQRRHRLVIISVIVLFFLVFRSPALIYGKLVTNKYNQTLCLHTDYDYAYYVTRYKGWINLSILFFIPLTVMTFCSVIMIRHLFARRTIGRTINRDSEHTAKKTTKLFITLNIVYIITNLPIRITGILVVTNLTYKTAYAIIIATIFTFTNHAINFLMYILHVPKFRAILRRMFHCRRCSHGEGNIAMEGQRRTERRDKAKECNINPQGEPDIHHARYTRTSFV